MNKFLHHWYTRDFGLWLIVAINLFLLVQYFQDASNATSIVIIFWVQTFFLGIENVLKMLFCKTGEIVKMNGVDKPSSFSTNLFFVFFFCVHYGIFLLIGGIMAILNKNLPKLDPAKLVWLYPTLLLILTGVIIEIPGKIMAVRKESPGLFKLMFVPYIRLFPFALIIFSDHFPKSLIFPAFLFLKLIVDAVYYFFVDRAGHKMITSSQL